MTEQQASLDIRVVRETAEFHALKDQWNELVDSSEYPNIFTTWEWASIWWKWYGEKELKGELFVLLLENGSELVGIVPFYRVRKGIPFIMSTRHLQLIGYDGQTCPEYLGPMIRKGWIAPVCEKTVAFLQENRKDWDSIFFEDYALDDPGTVALVEQMKGCFEKKAEPGEVRYNIQLPESYDTYLASLSYHNRRRKRERINQSRSRHNAVWYVVSEDTFDFWFQTLVELTNRAREKHKEKNPFLLPTFSGFHWEVCESLFPQGKVLPFILNFNDKPASAWYVYTFHGKCAAYQQGHDTNLKGSPSDVALQMLLMYLIENGFHEFDFLRGGEWYKTTFTDSGRKTESFHAFPKKNSAFFLFRFVHDIYLPLRRQAKQIVVKLCSLLKKSGSTAQESSSTDSGKNEVSS